MAKRSGIAVSLKRTAGRAEIKEKSQKTVDDTGALCYSCQARWILRPYFFALSTKGYGPESLAASLGFHVGSEGLYRLRGPVRNYYFRRRWKMRTRITLACTECKNRNYDTKKDKKLHPDRMETKKYCRFCRKHTLHKETK